MSRQIILSNSRSPQELEAGNMQKLTSGITSALGQYADMKKEQEKTARQRALEDRMIKMQDDKIARDKFNQRLQFQTGLASQGIQATPEEMQAYEQGDIGGLSGLAQRQAEAAKQKSANQARMKQQEFDLRRMQIESNKQQKDLLRQEKQQEKLQKQEAKNLELEIPGYGYARSKKEATDVRAAMADAEDAIKLIDQIKELGTDVNALTDWGRVAKINSAKKILAGKLRLPLTGPGAMTEDEFKRLIETMGDPSKMTSTEAIELGKLDQLKEVLKSGIQSKIKGSVVQSGQYQPIDLNSMNREQLIKFLQE